MNGKDRRWFEERFDKLDTKLDEHGERLTTLETKWSMATKFFGVMAGFIALITTVAVKIFWR